VVGATRETEKEGRGVTCYQRHMGWLFEALELPYEKDERRKVDTALREVLGTPDGAHCPEVWDEIKALSDEQRAGLPAEVSAVLDRG
jgi:hypothetical protein